MLLEGFEIFSQNKSLHEKCPNTEFFLVHTFLYLDCDFAPSLFQILHSVKAWNYNGNRNNMQENFFLKVY